MAERKSAVEFLPYSLVNGKPGDLLAVADRGLLYGDGLFETIAYQRTKLELVTLHLQRLQDGCRRLNIPLDISLLSKEIDAATEYLRSHHIQQAVLKIVITRGSGKRGYSSAECLSPTRIILVDDWHKLGGTEYSQGVRIRICDILISRSRSLAGLKHLNRLESVLARSEWDDPAIFEGLLCDDRGQIIEGTMSNVFIVDKQHRLLTPRLDESGIKGVLRQHIICNLASQIGMDCYEESISRLQLFSAREVFLTNSLLGIVAVIQCESNRWDKGLVTKALEMHWDSGKDA